jgi:uncharacterized damage-inducible protein DinB
MPTIAQTALADLDNEIANTRRVLERFPEGKGDFTPHPKSFTLGKLASHVASIPWLGSQALGTSVFDVRAPRPAQPAPATDAAAMVSLFDGHWQKFKSELDASSDAALLETWTLRAGDRVIMAMPRVAALRALIVNHLIHHRAQLTVYYRLLDVPVPGMYGPSADEM